jgi:hypothetical protein
VRAFFVLVPRPLTRTFVLFAPSLIPVWDLVSAGSGESGRAGYGGSASAWRILPGARERAIWRIWRPRGHIERPRPSRPRVAAPSGPRSTAEEKGIGMARTGVVSRMSRTPPPPLDGAIFLLGTAASARATTATRSNAVGRGLGDAPADDA